jgi:hypothetical protein
MIMQTKYETLSAACAALRNAGFAHNLATWAWHHADGRTATTEQGALTGSWRIRVR